MKMLTTAATLAAVLVSAGAVMAAPVVPRTSASAPPPASSQRGQYASNQNLRVARRHVERAIDRLQHDAEDYGGHREKAIDDLGLARQYLDQALDYRASRGRTPVTTPGSTAGIPVGRPVTGPVAMPGTGTVNPPIVQAGNGGENSNEFERSQSASNANLREVRRHVEAAIDALNRDASDYGGFKERAMDRLQAARAELEAALDFVHQPGVQNGGSGQRVSDANLQYVNEQIQTATTRLEQDRHDYAGHRVAAINDLNQASTYISDALSYDASHGDRGTAVPNVAAPSSVTVPGSTAGGVMPVGRPVAGHPAMVNQRNSNDSLADARRHLENALDALNRDAHDYGGFRVKAIGSLEAARTELLAALNSR